MSIITRYKKITALLAVTMLALVLIVCSSDDDDKGGNGNKGNGGGDVIDIKTYDADYAVFKKAMEDLLKTGKEFDAKELTFQAQSVYGFVGASISSLRFAVENVMAQKGAGTLAQVTADSRYASWDTIASISYASPYPYYFEGLLAHIAGKDSEAIDLYVKAMLNPAYPDDGLSFYYLSERGVAELRAIRDDLRKLETDVYALYTTKPEKIARDEYVFYPDYLRALSKDALGAGDKSLAVAYAKNAVLADPFDGANYKGAVVTLLAAEDFVSAVEYLDAGLMVAPEDDGLKLLYDIIKQTTEQGAGGLSKRSGLAASAALAALPWGAGSHGGVNYGNINYEPRSDAEKERLREQGICVKDMSASDVDAIIKSVMNAQNITEGMLINAITLIDQMGAESFGWGDVAKAAGDITGVNDAIDLYDIVMGNTELTTDDIQDYVADQVKDKIQDAAEEAVGKVTVKVGAKLGLKVSPVKVVFLAADIAEVGLELYEKYERIKDAMKAGEERIKMLDDFYEACNIEIEYQSMNSGEYDCCDDEVGADAQAECRCAKPENANTFECECRANPDDPKCDPCEEAPGTLKCYCDANPDDSECKEEDPCADAPDSDACLCKNNPDWLMCQEDERGCDIDDDCCMIRTACEIGAYDYNYCAPAMMIWCGVEWNGRSQ